MVMLFIRLKNFEGYFPQFYVLALVMSLLCSEMKLKFDFNARSFKNHTHPTSLITIKPLFAMMRFLELEKFKFEPR